MEGLEPPMFIFRFTKAVLSPLSHIGIKMEESFKSGFYWGTWTLKKFEFKSNVYTNFTK